MSLLDWTGEEKLPHNCACIGFAITRFHKTDRRHVSFNGTITITHYYANEWFRHWSANSYCGDQWIVQNDGVCTYRRFVDHVEIDPVIIEFIIKKLQFFLEAKKGRSNIRL